MSTINVTKIQHETGVGDNITLDTSGNVVCAADVQSTSQNGGPLDHINFLINPYGEINQRGLETYPANSYTADHWFTYGGITRIDGSQLLPGDSARGKSFVGLDLHQPIELTQFGRVLADQVCTQSVWVLGQQTPQTSDGPLWQSTWGTGAQTKAGEVLRDWEQTGEVSNGYYRYSRTLRVGIYNSTANFLGVGINFDPQATFTGMQFELGEVATPLQVRDPATELALCQRFYQKGAGGNRCQDVAYVIGGTVMFPTQMRATPTLSVNNYNLNAINNTVDEPTLTLQTPFNDNFYWFVNSTTFGSIGPMTISFGWTANAEF